MEFIRSFVAFNSLQIAIIKRICRRAKFIDAHCSACMDADAKLSEQIEIITLQSINYMLLYRIFD